MIAKILQLVLGVLLLRKGIQQLFSPVRAFLGAAGGLGVGAIIDAIGQLAEYRRLKAEGLDARAVLAGALGSLAIGVVMLASEALQGVTDIMLATATVGWMLVAGVSRIVSALGLRMVGERREEGPSTEASSAEVAKFVVARLDALLARSWKLHLASGVLLVLLGILSFAHPMLPVLIIGERRGYTSIATGAALIAAALG